MADVFYAVDSPSGGSYNSRSMDILHREHCALFEFIVTAVFTGIICLFGFAGNTLSFGTLWQEKNISSSTFLLQASLIADFAVIWMLFIGDVMPALGFAVPLLRDCSIVCGYVRAVTQPLMFLGQVCVIWFTMLAIVNRYIIMCRPTHAPLLCTVDFARKQVIVTIILAVLLTLPMTFDSTILLKYQIQNTTASEPLVQNHWYRIIYLNALIFILVYVVPLLGILYVSYKLFRILQSMKRLRRSLATSFKIEHTDMTQVLLTLAVSLFVCYLPLLTLKGMEWAHGKQDNTCGQLQYYLANFSKMFMAANSSIKLFILLIFSCAFRLRTKENVCCQCSGKASDEPILGMYKCADMSEMTLMSNMDCKM